MASRNLRLQVLLSAVDKVTGPLKKITQGNTATAQAIKANRDELKHLEKAQKSLNSFRDLTRQSQGTSRALRENQQRIAALSQEISTSANPTRALIRERDKLVRQSGTLKNRYQQEQQRLQQLRGQIHSVEGTSGSLSNRKAQLSERIRQVNQDLANQQSALKRTAEQQRRLQKISDGASSVRRGGMVTAAAGAGAYYGASRLGRSAWQQLGTGMEFDATMSRVQALTRLDKNDPQLAALREQAKQLGATTSFTSGEAASGQAFLAMAGFTPDAIRAAMPGLLDMARAGDMELGRTADIASNVLGGFKLDASEMGRVADILTKAFTTSNTTLEMLGGTMEYVGPVASAAGMSLEETAAMAGLLGNVGIQSNKAGTTLRAMLLRISAPAGPAAAAMEELGLQTKDAEGNVRGIVDILGDVAKATENMGSGDQLSYLKAIFGEEPAAGMAELLSQAGAGGITKYLDVVRDSQGAAAAVAATMADNLLGDLNLVKSAWASIQEEVFDTQNDALREQAKQLTEVLQGVNQWIKANPELVASIAKWGAIILAVIAVLGILAFTIGSLMIVAGSFVKIFLGFYGSFKKLAVPLGYLTKGFWALRAAMLANPISLVIVLIVALVALVILLWRNFEGFRNFMLNLWGGITDRWNAVTEWFSGFIGGFKTAWEGGFGSLLAWTGNLFLQLAKVFTDFSPLGLLYSGIAKLLNYFGFDLPGKFTEFGAAMIDGLISGITGGLNAAKEAVMGAGLKAIGWFKNVLGINSPSRVFADLGRDTLTGYEQGINGQENDTLNRVKSFAQKAAAAGAGIALSGAVMASDGVQFDTRLALPPAASHAPAGDNITINIYPQAGMDATAIGREVERILQERDRAKARQARSLLYDR